MTTAVQDALDLDVRWVLHPQVALRPESFGALLVLPVFLEQVGQAFMPCSALTRSATAICSSRLALWACPSPPKDFQVDGVNCSPPENPLPVLIDQSPVLSHWASSSQSVSA